MPPRCANCGKGAVLAAGPQNTPLCVDCYLKLVQAIQIQNAMLMEEANNIMAEMEAVVGLPGVLPRYKVPQPIIRQGPVTFNNINVANSVVGSINTGQVKRIDVAMDRIKISGDNDLVRALKEFSEAVINDRQLDADLKNELIEQIGFISSQAVLTKEKQQPGLIKAVIGAIQNAVAPISTLLSLWDVLRPLLEGKFF